MAVWAVHISNPGTGRMSLKHLPKDPLNRDKGLSVRQYDSPLRYLVKSRSRDGVEYLVDLETMECQCEDFVFRHYPNRRKYNYDESVTMCAHCDAAFKHFSLSMLHSVISLCKEGHISTRGNNEKNTH